jgi:hypothetical protein
MSSDPQSKGAVPLIESKERPSVQRPLQPYADPRYFYDPDFYPEARGRPFKDPKDEFRVDL